MEHERHKDELVNVDSASGEEIVGLSSCRWARIQKREDAVEETLAPAGIQPAIDICGGKPVSGQHDLPSIPLIRLIRTRLFLERLF
jgi:hypothetical protein